MMDKTYQEVIAEVGPFPGLSDWCNRGILALRSGDITLQRFQDKLQVLIKRLENQYNEVQPENMEEETYQIAKEYYLTVSETLDHYLEGMELMLEWSTTGSSSILSRIKLVFEAGDQLAHQTTVKAFELQDEFREIDEALIQHLRATSGGNAP